jgi:hypothetical protein
MKQIQLSNETREYLFAGATTGGGFQSFIGKLQKQCDAAGILQISDSDIEKIKQYATNGQGGWQNFFHSLADLIGQ